jgi:hypothetical protein
MPSEEINPQLSLYDLSGLENTVSFNSDVYTHHMPSADLVFSTPSLLLLCSPLCCSLSPAYASHKVTEHKT